MTSSDSQHGNRGGGPLHSVATTDVAGFMSAEDKAALDVATGRTPIGTLLTSSGTTFDLIDIPATCRRLYIEIDGVSFSGIATLKVAVSADNGLNFGTARSISDPTTGAGDAISGSMNIDNLQTSALGCVARPVTFIDGVVATRFATTTPLLGFSSAVGPYNAIQFSGGTFDAGEIRVYSM